MNPGNRRKGRKHIKNRTRAVIACLIMLAVLFNSDSPRSQNPVAAASTAEALEEAKQKQRELAAEQARLSEQTNQLSSQADQLSGELAWLNQRSAEQKKLYEEKTLQLAAAIDEMEKAYSAYIEAEETLAAKQEQYAERVQVMFEHRKKSIFELFLESENLQGFFTTLQFMSIVADTDEQMIEELEAARDDAELKREVAKQYSEEMTAVVAQIKGDLEKLRADVNACESDLSKVEARLSQSEKAEDDLLAESEKLKDQIVTLQKKLEAEKAAAATKAAEATRAAQASRAAAATKAAEATRAAQAAKAAETKKTDPVTTPKPTSKPQVQTPNSRGWVWPYPGDYGVYSGFGMRYHPIYHTNRMHTGVDLGGDYGCPVVAAADGTVLMVVNPREGSNTGGYGYGNYIIIDHGGGISTLYGHLKNTLVHAGQSVEAGAKIATCGSTGTSTGAHLHFEVLVNGNPVNPLPYIR